MTKNVNTDGCPFHSTASIDGFDMLDEQIRQHPWPHYDWLRMDPSRRVYQLANDSNFYLLHQYEDVKAAFLNTETLKSQIFPSQESLFVALMDDEEHRRVRAVLSSVFMPKNLKTFTAEIESIVKQCTKEAVSSQSIDLLKDWAIPIPMKVLAALMNLPVDDATAEKLYLNALAINRAIFVTGGTGPRRSSKPSPAEKFSISLSMIKNLPRLLQLAKVIGWRGMKELRRKLKVVDNRLALPRPNFKTIPAAIRPFLELLITMGEQLNNNNSKDDKLSELKSAVHDGVSTKLEMMLATAFILFAGHETSISLLSNCFIHLAKNPDMYDRIKIDRSLIEPFIEESLRYYTPVGRFLRRVVKPLKIGEQRIPNGAIVILMLGAANTDPSKFEQGCAFDINRSNVSQHLSFGKGQHFCLGAQLARTMAKITISELLDQTNSIAILNDESAEFVTDRDNGVYRYEKIKVVLSG